MDPDASEATTSVDMAALLADPAGSAVVLAGRYRLGDVLGEGGTSVVHRAEDTLLQRPVAVKLLRENVTGVAERARFIGEVRTLGALSHAGLVTVLDAGVTAERPYLVMELVEGGTLADVPTPLPLARVAELGAQIASAIAHAHSNGVIHRDVKPANVLLGPNGRLKLADFGIARIIGDTVHHTGTGALIGTVSYLSPEQVAGDELTTALDVYSLGLVLLELITGQRPFPGPSVESALSRLTRPPEMPLDLPAAWWALLSAMTARDPADRPTASEVSERLDRLRGGTPRAVVGAPAPARLSMPPVAMPAPPPSSPRSRVPAHLRGALVAVAALVLLIAAAAAAGGKGVRGNGPGDAASAVGATGVGQSAAQAQAGADDTLAAGPADLGGGAERARKRGDNRHKNPPAAAAGQGPESKHTGGRKSKSKDKDKDKAKGKDGGKHDAKGGHKGHGKGKGKGGPKHR